MIPPTRFINPGPMPAEANPTVAMASGKALSEFGNVIKFAGAKGLEHVERVRKIEERGKIAGFLRMAEETAAGFRDGLMTRSDTDQWNSDWKNTTADLSAKFEELDLSPEAKAAAKVTFDNWVSEKSVGVETAALSKKVRLGAASMSNAAEYHFRRGETSEGKAVLHEAADAGLIDPPELEEGLRRGDEIAARSILAQEIDANPRGTLEQLESGEWLKNTPGATLDLVERGKRYALDRIETIRSAQMDTLETALKTGTLHPRDIEAAQFIDDNDRKALAYALARKTPPTNEEHGRAWKALDSLREARGDTAVSAEAYRKIWNETRGLVLSVIPPEWQGDISKELSYLSPAGRSPSGGSNSTGYDRADLEAIGRDIAFRARDAGFFGSIEDEAPPAEREKAYRKAEDIRLAVKRFLVMNPQATPEQVREHTDGLISGDRVKDAARSLQSFVPGAAQSLRPAPAAPIMPALPPKQGSKDKAAADPLQIPAGPGEVSDSLLPARQKLDALLSDQ